MPSGTKTPSARTRTPLVLGGATAAEASGGARPRAVVMLMLRPRESYSNPARKPASPNFPLP